jgi:hypothetical protein
MQPQKPTSSNGSEYDFIINTDAAQEPETASRFSKKRLLIVLAVISLGLIVAMLLLFDTRTRANLAQKDRLIEIAQMQTEIKRIAAIGAEKSDTERTKSRAQAIESRMEESIKTTESLMNAREVSYDEELLKAKEDSTINEDLDKTAEFSTFNRAYTKVMDTKLLEYQRLLLAAKDKGNGEESQAFQAAYDDTNAMLGLIDK